jgi:phospholipase C
MTMSATPAPGTAARPRRPWRSALGRLSAAAALLCLATAAAAEEARGLGQIDTVVVIYLENRSFDNLFGLFPGADGLAAAASPQVDERGEPYAALPPVVEPHRHAPPTVDARFPAALPNKPFPLEPYAPLGQKTASPTHLFRPNQEQIDGGRNDRFVSGGEVGGLPMGYYDGSKTKLWKWAERYVLADRFFQAAFGGSFLNHQWLVCACAPRYEGAPRMLIDDGTVTDDGYAVNTIESELFHRPGTKHATLPPQTAATIGDRLSDKGVDWAWYAGGYAEAAAGQPDDLFQYHHQPFAFYARYAPGTAEAAKHLRDDDDFFADIQSGTLPAVSFYKPNGRDDEHAGYANVEDGDANVDAILGMLEKSPQWGHMAVIVTYDEFGGWYDHVAPPRGDRWGPGSRIPAIVVSPFAKRGVVDHTTYDTTSILAFIEKRWGLEPLGGRDAAADPLSGAFDFR